MSKSVKTPCIGICSTVFGDEVCRGCKRYQNEIIEWNSFNDSEKRAVLDRLETLKVQIMDSKIHVFDEILLKQQLQHHKVRFVEDNNPLCWVFDLLRSGSESIQDPKDFGFDLISSDSFDLSELKRIMEEELFDLSEAHHQRYFKVEKYFNV